EHAGTDDYVWVRFRTKRSGGAKYYLDYGNNDFERASRKVYELANLTKAGFQVDVNTMTFSTVRDIQEFVIGKEGDDGLYLKRVALLLNNSSKPIFTHEFTPGRWLDTETGFRPSVIFTSADLRSNPSWTVVGNDRLVMVPQTLTISRGTLDGFIESYMGDYMHETKLLWAQFEGDHVVSKRTSLHTSSFLLYLEYDAPGLNPTVDLFFDLTVSCAGGKLSLSVGNVTSDVDYPLWLDILSLGITKVIEEVAQSSADSFTGSIAFSLAANLPLCTKGT